MAAKYQFSNAERFAVWRSFDGVCFWCNRPLDLLDCTIDHVIPESLQGDPLRLQKVRTDYGLNQTFSVNGFENWVPACAPCNRAKSRTIFRPTPAVILELERVSRKAPSSAAVFRRVTLNKDKGKILGQVMVALDMGTLVREDLISLLRETDPSRLFPEPGASDVPDELIVGGWKINRRDGDIAYVSRSGRHGYTYVGKGNDFGFRCPSCGSLGPWNGTFCQTCGMQSDPSD